LSIGKIAQKNAQNVEIFLHFGQIAQILFIFLAVFVQ
jgi:hypothetical protein